MQWSLFLFMLMGQCFLCSCRFYTYHLIYEERTWNEAQAFCRDKYSDLATVTKGDDTRKLQAMMRTANIKEAWIGLQSNKGRENRKWHWSQPWVESNEAQFRKDWADHGLGHAGGENNNCVVMKMSDRKWAEDDCGHHNAFICHNDTDPVNPSFSVINEGMTWLQAQSYCREHHTDLISGLKQLEQIPLSTLKPEYVWIGLFRDTWRWSDESDFSFRNWKKSGEFEDGMKKKECATVTETSGEWSSVGCDEKKPFFCYEDKVVLVQRKMKWWDALFYCQDEYDIMVTITDAGEQRWVQAKAKKATTSHVWLGLYYTCTLDFWFWFSEGVVVYKNWGPGQEENSCNMSGAMSRAWAHKWFKQPVDEYLNFICSKF